MIYVWRRISVSVLVVVSLGVSAVGAAAPSARSGALPSRPAHPVRLAVLSTRADLVSGGEALVQVLLPPGARAAQARLDVNGRDVTREFAPVSSGKLEGLVT